MGWLEDFFRGKFFDGKQSKSKEMNYTKIVDRGPSKMDLLDFDNFDTEEEVKISLRDYLIKFHSPKSLKVNLTREKDFWLADVLLDGKKMKYKVGMKGEIEQVP